MTSRLLEYFPTINDSQREWLENRRLYLGDIHNHCGISYGYGRLEDAIAFARNQLDFFSVTGHFAWPDMETYPDRKIPNDVIEYHKKGFKKLRRNWPEYRRLMREAESESFLPFPSYEYHSFYYGDYTVVSKYDCELPEPVKEGDNDNRLEVLLKGNDMLESGLMPLPHHIGYKTGYRGINWAEFRAKASPLVEIVSMHGCAESHDARLKYLHTMGPKSFDNTMQGGLGKGLVFGVAGNTDHHNASPGSYGFGRTGVWAKTLDRNSLWEAMAIRNTIAFTGDKVECAAFVDNYPIGSILDKREGIHHFDGYVSALDSIDVVEVIKDNQVVYSVRPKKYAALSRHGFVGFSFGWGKKHNPCSWNIRISLEKGKLVGVSPRLRGIDLVDPLDAPKGNAVPRFSYCGNEVLLSCITDGNMTATTDNTQGFVMEINVDDDAIIRLNGFAEWCGSKIEIDKSFSLFDIRKGVFTDYIDGFVSPSYQISRFVPIEDTLAQISFDFESQGNSFIYLRGYQNNGDGFYVSPIFC